MNSADDLQKKFDALPQAIKDAITSVDFATKLQTIGKNHGLHLDELDSLFEEVGFVMLGETKPQDFKNKLAKRLSITEEKATPIVKTLDQEIFRPIKIALVEGAVATPTSSPSGANFLQAVQSASITPNPNPPIVKPHEADYDMSRDAILSAIENPPAPEVKIDYTPRRSPESSDPQQYLLNKKGLSAILEKGTPEQKKRSLSEEAVIIAKKKSDDIEAISTPKVEVPSKISVLPQQKSPLSPPVSKTPVGFGTVPPTASPEIITKPADKLNTIVQIPSAKVEVKKTPTPPIPPSGGNKAVDPYREAI